MKRPNLTRQMMYELVWSKPATELAKELSVSDVAIGKICKRFNIPKPTMGYWAKLAAGKEVHKAELPESNTWFDDNCYVFGGSNYYYSSPSLAYWEPADDNEPPPAPPAPPTFDESIEAYEERMEKQVKKLRFSETLEKRHRLTDRLIAGDLERVAECKGSYFCFRKPRFQDENGKAVLAALNKLFYAWDSIGATAKINGPKAQNISVNLRESAFWFNLYAIPKDDDVPFKIKQRTKSKFALRWGYPDEYRPDRSEPAFYFDELNRAALSTIVLTMIVKAEKEVRSDAERQYRSIVQHIDDELRKREERRLAAIERHKAEVKKLMEDRIGWTNEALLSIEKSDRLRSLIDAYDKKYDESGKSIAGYEKWRQWAVHQSQMIDPRFRSIEHIEEWIARFKLQD